MTVRSAERPSCLTWTACRWDHPGPAAATTLFNHHHAFLLPKHQCTVQPTIPSWMQPSCHGSQAGAALIAELQISSGSGLKPTTAAQVDQHLKKFIEALKVREAGAKASSFRPAATGVLVTEGMCCGYAMLMPDAAWKFGIQITCQRQCASEASRPD